jgi:GT2 family glycosyltransferase
MRSLHVAVVIVTYRSAALTVESLASLAAERATAGLTLRAIVVDNASGDLPAIERAVSDHGWSDWVTLLAAPKNGGFAYGNNLGMREAFERGPPDYLYLLNPDAQVRPGAIAALARFLESHPEVGIAGSSFETLDGSEWPIAFRFPTLVSELIGGLELGLASRILRRWVVANPMTQVAQPTDWICGASMLIRPSVVSTIGGMDENYFLYFEETDFCLRAKRAGFSTWYVPESRVMHIMGQSTSVTNVTNEVRRLPDYWFDSRRRYFAASFGIAHAIAIDVVAVIAHALGSVKRLALGRRHRATPHYIRDLIRHSVLWPRNRSIPAVQSYRPSGDRAAIPVSSRSG